MSVHPGATRRQGFSRTRFETVVDGSVLTAALENPVNTTTRPATGVIDTKNYGNARIVFTGTDAENETINYQVILWAPLDLDNDVWIPLLAAKGTVTLGALTTNTGIHALNGFYADTLTDTVEKTGTIIHSPEDDSIAFLDVDLGNCWILEIETDRGTGASASVHVRLGEGGTGAGVDIDISGTGLATSALQTTSEALLKILIGSDLTFTRVALITAGAATTELLAKTASQTQRLHALVITVSAAALVEIEDKDGGVLATWNFGANGGVVKSFNANPDSAIQQSVVNKGLQIVNSAGNLGGYAIVSTG